MNTTYTSLSPEETEHIGTQIGQNLRGGEVIELVSDLGGGKTTLTKGIVAGAGSSDRVSSPTFTVSKEYAVPPQIDRTLVTITHIDLYRLGEVGLMKHELAELVADTTHALIIEWADIAKSSLPKTRVTISIIAIDESSRQIIIECPDQLSYLLKDVR